MSDERLFTLSDDCSGSGRVTRLVVNDTLVWTWAWHIDGPPSNDARGLLRALGMTDPLFSSDYCHEPGCEREDDLLVYTTEDDEEIVLCREHAEEWANDE